MLNKDAHAHADAADGGPVQINEHVTCSTAWLRKVDERSNVNALVIGVVVMKNELGSKFSTVATRDIIHAVFGSLFKLC